MNINVLQEKQHGNFSTDCQIVLHFVDILNLRDYFLSQFPEVFESKYKDIHCLNSSYFHCNDHTLRIFKVYLHNLIGNLSKCP